MKPPFDIYMVYGGYVAECSTCKAAPMHWGGNQSVQFFCCHYCLTIGAFRGTCNFRSEEHNRGYGIPFTFIADLCPRYREIRLDSPRDLVGNHEYDFETQTLICLTPFQEVFYKDYYKIPLYELPNLEETVIRS